MATVTDQTARRLREAVRHLIVAHGALEHARRPCGAELSLPHAYALLELYQRGEPMTVSELAETLAIDRTNVSRLCARMEDLGEVEKRAHPRDSRARVLRLTSKGAKIARGVDASSARHFERIRSELGTSATNVIQSLSRLAQAMSETTGEHA